MASLATSTSFASSPAPWRIVAAFCSSVTLAPPSSIITNAFPRRWSRIADAAWASTPAPPRIASASLTAAPSSRRVPLCRRSISRAAATAAPITAAAVPALATNSPSAASVMTRSSMRPRAIAQPAGWLTIRSSRGASFSRAIVAGIRTPMVPRPYCAFSPNLSSADLRAALSVIP